MSGLTTVADVEEDLVTDFADLETESVPINANATSDAKFFPVTVVELSTFGIELVDKDVIVAAAPVSEELVSLSAKTYLN